MSSRLYLIARLAGEAAVMISAMVEWITGVALIAIIMAANVWLAWWIGRYEMTGVRGWRRIPAGLWLAHDTWNLWIHRWIARHKRDSGDRS